MLRIDVIKRLDHRPAQLLRNPPALGHASFDPVDAAVALLRIVVAGVYDDHVVGNSGKQIGWQVATFFWGIVTMTTSPLRAASVTETGVEPVSRAKPASVSGPLELATKTWWPSAVKRRVRVPPIWPAPMMLIFISAP